MRARSEARRGRDGVGGMVRRVLGVGELRSRGMKLDARSTRKLRSKNL